MKLYRALLGFMLLISYCNPTIAQDLEFVSHFKSADNNRIQQFSIDSDGNSYLLGQYKGTLSIGSQDYPSYGENDLFVAKILENGDLDWIQTFGSKKGEVPVDIRFAPSGRLFVCGAFWDTIIIDSEPLYSPNVRSVFLSEFNPVNGDLVWAKNIITSDALMLPTTFSIGTNDSIYLSGSYVINAIFESETFTWNGTLNSYAAVFDDLGNLAKVEDLIAKNNNTTITSFFPANDGYFIGGRYIDSLMFRNDTLFNDGTQVDAFVGYMDLDFNLHWARRLFGTGNDYLTSYESIGQELYITGYSDSPELYIETEFIDITKSNPGGDDVFIAKYNTSGSLLWITTNGSLTGDMRSYDLAEVENDILITGFLTDTIIWGNDTLKTNGPTDRDVYVLRCSKAQGQPISSLHISFDTLNSEDIGRSVGSYQGEVYIAAITDAPKFTLGDSTYSGNPGFESSIFSIYGCRALAVDNVIAYDVLTCYNDTSGSIQITISGGFGEPILYSIDDGTTYQTNDNNFPHLPAGEYTIVIRDKVGCPAEYHSLVVIDQPDSLEVEFISSDDITEDHDGSIVVVANGGTSPYTFYLAPDGDPQAIGTFTFVSGDSGTYVVAVDDLNGCGPALTNSIKISEIIIPVDTTGIEGAFGLNVKVYPNPTSGNITIEMPFEGTECEMEVLSMTGQLVLKRRVFSNGGVLNESLDLSDQAKGLYMLRVNGVTLRSAIMVK
jgi:hypothetical protein